MTTYARQAEVLKVTREEALEGYFYFVRTREAKAEKFPDLVEARLEAAATLDQLARIEAAYGHEKARAWLAKAVERAEGQGAA